MKLIKTKMDEFNGSDKTIDVRKPKQKEVIMEILKGPLFTELDDRCNIDNYNNDSSDDNIKDSFSNFLDVITGSDINTYINSNGPIETAIKTLANSDAYSNKLKTLINFIFAQNNCPGALFKALLKYYSVNNGMDFKINYENVPGQKQGQQQQAQGKKNKAPAPAQAENKGGSGKRKSATKKSKRANKRRKTVKAVKRRTRNVVVL
jgi:hypothetical protein